MTKHAPHSLRPDPASLPASSPLADTPSHANDPREACGAALLEAVYPGRVRSRETLCLSLLECDCDRTRSLRASAPAEWEKCIAQGIPNCSGMQRSKYCRKLLQAIRIAWRDSSREAKVLAFLNHPIMAAIYGVEDGRW